MESIQYLQQTIRRMIRELGSELATLNRQVGVRVDLREGDLGCLDLLARFGPMSPSALAKRAQMHPATMTGVLDRLEGAGWIERQRDPTDRRAVLLRARGERAREMMGQYAGMNASIDEICASYEQRDLAVVADFLTRLTEAGRTENARLAANAGSEEKIPLGHR
jgi:DNA-binding MarR family transcriptional regulator